MIAALFPMLLAAAAQSPAVPPAAPPAPDRQAELHCAFGGATLEQIDRAIAAENLDMLVPEAERDGSFDRCIERFGWSEERTGLMSLYANALISERSSRHYSRFTPAQLARIDRAYEATNAEEMRRLVGAVADHYIENEGRMRNMTREESRFFGDIATRGGISNAGAMGVRVDPIVMFRLIREVVTERLFPPAS
jgi:hypothetical protein